MASASPLPNHFPKSMGASDEELPEPVTSLDQYHVTPSKKPRTPAKDMGACALSPKQEPNPEDAVPQQPKNSGSSKKKNIDEVGYIEIAADGSNLMICFLGHRKRLHASSFDTQAAMNHKGEEWLSRFRGALRSGEKISVKDQFLDPDKAMSAAGSADTSNSAAKPKEKKDKEEEKATKEKKVKKAKKDQPKKRTDAAATAGADAEGGNGTSSAGKRACS